MDSEPDLPEATQTPPPRSPAARVANTPKKTASTPRKPATPRQPRQNASAATDDSAPATPAKPTTPAKSTPKAPAKPTTAKPATARASSTRAATPRTTTPRSTTPKAATAKPAADKSVAAPNAEKPPVKRAPTKRTATKTTKQADVTEPDVTTSTPSAAAAPDSAPTAESSAVESPAAETPAAQSPAAATSVPKVPAKRPVRRPAAKKTAVVEPTVESATAEPVVSEPVVSEAAVESSVIETVEPVEEPTTLETAVKTTADETTPDEKTAETTAVEKTGKAKKVRPVAAEAIENLRVVETDASGTEIVLKITGLVKRFDDKTAVAGIDLQIAAGSFFGIVGPNGAGKTTTLSMVTGLLKPDAGHITVHGADVWANPVVAKRTMGVLPDRLRLFDRLTGAQLLYYSGILHGLGKSVVRSRSADLAAAFGLEDSLDRLVTDYSAGMTKKIAIAAAMIHSPRLLVLDEPFESVDPVSAANVIEILQKYVAAGGTVVMSSHTMNLIERICDSVAVVVNGAVLATGTMDEVRGDKSLEDRFVELAGGRKAAEGMEWLHKFSD